MWCAKHGAVQGLERRILLFIGGIGLGKNSIHTTYRAVPLPSTAPLCEMDTFSRGRNNVERHMLMDQASCGRLDLVVRGCVNVDVCE